MQKLEFDELLHFLKTVDTSFPVPLSAKQPLEGLAQKFCEKANLCHVEENGEMVGKTVEELNEKHNVAVQKLKVINSQGQDMMRRDLLPVLY